MNELEKNILATLYENGCTEKQAIAIMEEILKHIIDYLEEK